MRKVSRPDQLPVRMANGSVARMPPDDAWMNDPPAATALPEVATASGQRGGKQRAQQRRSSGAGGSGLRPQDKPQYRPDSDSD